MDQKLKKNRQQSITKIDLHVKAVRTAYHAFTRVDFRQTVWQFGRYALLRCSPGAKLGGPSSNLRCPSHHKYLTKKHFKTCVSKVPVALERVAAEDLGRALAAPVPSQLAVASYEKSLTSCLTLNKSQMQIRNFAQRSSKTYRSPAIGLFPLIT